MPILKDNSRDNVDWGQPVNWNHPLNHGLASWWIAVSNHMGYGSLSWRDMVQKSSNHGTLTNMDPATDWVAGDHFGALDFATGGTEDIRHDPPFFGVSAFSFAIRMYIRSTGTHDYAGAWASLTAKNQHYLRYSAGLQWFVRNSADSAEANITISSPPTGQWIDAVFTADGSNLRGYLDGVLSAGPTALAGPYIPQLTSGTIKWFFGRSRFQDSDFLLSSAAYWDHALSAGEVAGLVAETRSGWPNLLNRVPRRVYSVAAAGGTTANWYNELQQLAVLA